MPILFNTCEIDEYFPMDAQGLCDKVLGGGEMEKAGMYRRKY